MNCLKWLSKTTAEQEYTRKKKSSDDEDKRSSSHTSKRKGTACKAAVSDNKKKSLLDEEDARSVYSIAQMTVNNVDQDHKVIVKKLNMSTSEQWVIDSGASHHMTQNQNSFIVYKLKKSWVIIANEAQIESPDWGDVIINATDNSKTSIHLIDVLHVSKLDCNLMSILTLINKGLWVSFNSKRVNIHQESTLIATGFARGKLYILNPSICDIAFCIESETSSSPTCNDKLIYNQVKHYHIWHCWCGHWDHHNLCHLHEYVTDVDEAIKLSSGALWCDVCIKSKVIRVINRFTDQRVTQKFQWVYSDY